MQRKGFTLVELLVVVSIIGLLATIAVVSLGSARQKGRDAKRVADVRNISAALEQYYADQTTASYPVVASATTLGGATAKAISATNGIAATAAGTVYMGLVPADPGSNAYTYTSLTAAGAACTSAPCPKYTLVFTLEGTVGSLASGAHTQSQDGML